LPRCLMRPECRAAASAPVTVRVGPSPSDERDASHTTPEAPEVQRPAARDGR
jgi:hypothetical protein